MSRACAAVKNSEQKWKGKMALSLPITVINYCQICPHPKLRHVICHCANPPSEQCPECRQVSLQFLISERSCLSPSPNVEKLKTGKTIYILSQENKLWRKKINK